MDCPYSGHWKLLYDWQTLVAGSLALVAGLLAVWGAMRQVAATNRQTEHLQRETKREIARQGVASARLLGGVLSGLQDDVRTIELAWHKAQKTRDAAVAPSEKALLRLMPLDTVWQDLGRFSPDIISNYLNLDSRLTKFRTRSVADVEYNTNELESLRVIIENVRRLIDDEAKHAYKLLASTEYDPPVQTR